MVNKKRTLKTIVISLLAFALIISAGIAFNPQRAYASESVCTVAECGGAYENGFCTKDATHYQPANDTNSDGYYEIANAGNLYWYASQINSGNLLDGILTADITDNQQVLDAAGNLIADHASLRVWTPICLGVGQTITLKGNGHVISGIFANKENGEIDGIALFGEASANISNLGVVDSYFGSLESYGEYYTATFVGYSNASVIENCFSFATINTGYYSGGIVGLPEETEIKNCYFAGKLLDENHLSNAITSAAYNKGSVENSYYLSGLILNDPRATAIAAEDISSGFLAYALNGGKVDGTQAFYQTVGSGYPTFSGNTVYASTPCAIKFYNDQALIENISHDVDSAYVYDATHHWYVCKNGCAELFDKAEHDCDENGKCVCEYQASIKLHSTKDLTLDAVFFPAISTNVDAFIWENKSYNCFTLLQDVELDSLTVFNQTDYIDLNGFNLDSSVLDYSVRAQDNRIKVEDGKILNTYVYLRGDFENVVFESSPLVINSTDREKTRLKNVTIKNKDCFFEYIEGTAVSGLFEFDNVTFEEGIDISDSQVLLKDLFAGYDLFDGEGNAITVADDQKVIDEKFVAKKPYFSVEIEENVTTLYSATELESLVEGKTAYVKVLNDLEGIDVVLDIISSMGTEVTFDLNGKRVKLDNFYLTNVKLTITDCSEGSTGALIPTTGNATVQAYNSEVIFTGITVEESFFSAYIEDNSSVKLENCNFYMANFSFKNSSLEITSGNFEYLGINVSGEYSASIMGGTFDYIGLNGLTMADLLKEGYLPKSTVDGAFFTDLSAVDFYNIEIVAHTHVYNSYKQVENGHIAVCECLEIDPSATVEDHYGDPGDCENDTVCEACGYVIEYASGHNYIKIEYNQTHHWYTCEYCNGTEEGSYEEHNGNSADCENNSYCFVCDYLLETSSGHDYSVKNYDDYWHWDECVYCQEVLESSIGEHQGGHADCENDGVCDSCDYILEYAYGHDYSVINNDEEAHWYECSVCGSKEESSVEEHYGDPATCQNDSVCYVCEFVIEEKTAHVYEQYYANAYGHYLGCACGESNPDGEIEEHFGGEATCVDPAVCEECGSEYKAPLGHSFENGICTVCEEVAVLGLTVNEETYYFDDFSIISDAVKVLGGSSYTLTLYQDYVHDTENSAGTITLEAPLTVELNGFALSNLAIASSSKLTVKDSSEENTGKMSASILCLDTFSLENVDFEGLILVADLSNIIFSQSADFTSSAGEINIIGGNFVGQIVLYSSNVYINAVNATLEEMHIIVENATSNAIFNLDNSYIEMITVDDGEETATLADVLPSGECVTYEDAEGNAVVVDLTLSAYQGTPFTIKAEHPSVGEDAEVFFDEKYHWNECSQGHVVNKEEHAIEDGKCSVCNYMLAVTVEYDNQKAYFADFSKALDFATMLYEATLTLNSSIFGGTTTQLTDIQINNELTIDLNGNQLILVAYLTVNGKLTVTDCSEDGDGSIYFVGPVGNYGTIVLNRGTVEAYLQNREGALLYVNGAKFVDSNIEIEKADDFIVTKLIAEESDICLQDAELSDLFVSECYTVTDADNNPLVFTSSAYSGNFTIVHIGEVVEEYWLSDGFAHWHGCATCNMRYDEGVCTGGEATCVSLAVCEVCNRNYGYFRNHVLEEDACINCDLTAAVKLEIDGSVNYYQYFEDALEDADDVDEPTIITLLQDVDNYTLDVNGGIITIDLAGNKLTMDCLYVYEGTVIFTDSKRSNTNNLDLELYIYNGEVIFDYVVADNLYVRAELYDDDSMAVTFNEVEIWYLYIGVYGSTNYSIDINGGTYGYMTLSLNELGDFTILSAIVEEQIEVSGEGDNYFITNLFDSNCVTLKNEYGKPFTLDEDVSCYDGYIEFAKHSTCEAKEEYFADNKNHWLECECGSIVGEKQAHTGGEATCVSLAVCEVCEEEYGDYAHHLFDNRGVCSVCKQITYVYAKVVALGEEIFFGNIEDALDYAQTVESVTVTLLEDAYGDYLPLYSGNITLDLNGYDLEVEELSLYGANLTVKDSLNSKNNYVEFEFTTDIYSGTLVIEGGNFANDICYFDLDPEGDSASLIIKGGNFIGIDIDTDSAGDLTVIIEGGRFVDACYFDIDDELNIMLRGGIFEKGISIGNDRYESYDLLSLISNVECVLATDKAGEEVTFINSVLYLGYLQLSHTQTAVGDYDGSHHWNKCACGEVLSEKQEHSYTDACDATCNVCNAIREVPNHVYDNACDTTCNVCSAEREVPNHVYDNNCDRDCNVCSAERSIEHVYDNACDTTCNECGEERSVENHIWKETITAKAATTKENGKGIIECAECGEKHEIVIPAKGGMSAGGIVATSVGGTLAVNAGAFSIIWFAVKKKKFKDLFTK